MRIDVRLPLAIIALVASCLGAQAQTGSVKSPATLNTEVNTLFPDQFNGLITPFDARQTLLDIIASNLNIAPSNGIIINSTPVTGGTTGNCLFVNGSVIGNQTCGGGGGGGNLVIGTTTVGGGSVGYFLYIGSGGLLQNSATTGSGNVALNVSPVFTTPILGAATATSINGLQITASTGTLTIPNGTTLALSGGFNTTLTATGITNVTLPTSGTLATTSQVPSLPVSPANGGTGISNTGTITLGGNLATSGASALTLTTTGATNVTFPTSGTLVNTGVTTLSSLTSIGTIGTGTWQGTIVSPTYGGTGVNNGSQSLTLSGGNNLTLTTVGATNVTFPTSGTLVNTGVTALSSLVTVGTIGTGTWQATAVGPAYGGTGIANNAANTLTFSGNYGLTLTLSNTTSVTLPTSGTLLSTAAAITLAQGGTNASLTASNGGIVYSGASAFAILSGTGSAGQCLLSGSNAAPTWGSCTGAAAVSSLGNASADTTLTVAGTGSGPWTGAVTVKINLGNANTWTAAQTFDSGDFLLAGSGSGTTTVNAAAAASGTLTLPAATDTLVGRATTDTLTNKSIAGSEINSGTVGATYGGTGVNNGSSTITLGGSLTMSGAFTFTGTVTANTSVTFPTSGTLVNTGVTTLSSLTSIGTIGTGTWQGSVVGATYGGTGVNNGSSTLTLAASLTTTGTGAPTLAFGSGTVTLTMPTATSTLATLTQADQTLSGGANVTSYSIGTVTTGTTQIDCGKSPLQYMTNGGASTISAPANDGSCIVYILNNGSAGAITFSGFTESSNTGDSLTTTNTSKFFVSIAEINGIANYIVRALQ